jgi:hypothetical protein
MDASILISIRMEPDILAMLDRQAKVESKTRTAVIHEMLRAILDAKPRNKPARGGSSDKSGQGSITGRKPRTAPTKSKGKVVTIHSGSRGGGKTEKLRRAVAKAKRAEKKVIIVEREQPKPDATTDAAIAVQPATAESKLAAEPKKPLLCPRCKKRLKPWGPTMFRCMDCAENFMPQQLVEAVSA